VRRNVAVAALAIDRYRQAEHLRTIVATPVEAGLLDLGSL